MTQFFCENCKQIVTSGETHPCFNYKKADDVYVLPQLDEVDEKHANSDESIDELTVNDNAWKLGSAAKLSVSEELEQLSNEKFVFTLSSKTKRKHSSMCEDSSIIERHSKPRYNLLIVSTSNNQVNRVQSKENASHKTSTETFETGYRSESDFPEVPKRKSITTKMNQNKCETPPSTSIHPPFSVECEMSLEKSKWLSLEKDKDAFMESLKRVSQKTRLVSKNNYKIYVPTSSALYPVNKEPSKNVIELSKNLSANIISYEIVSEPHSRSINETANISKLSGPIDSTKVANDVAGPSNSRTYSCTPANKRKFLCDICHREFPYKSMLDVHYRIHTGEKPYKCDLCDNEFSRKSNLDTHRRTHTGEKPFVCDVCQIGFAHQTTLKRHAVKHMDKKPFECVVCTKGFTRKSNLINHIQTHSREKSCKCRVCGMINCNRYHKDNYE